MQSTQGLSQTLADPATRAASPQLESALDTAGMGLLCGNVSHAFGSEMR